MLTITGYSVELIKDPFGILTGERYEFIVDIEVPEDDELYSDKGIYVRAVYRVEDAKMDMLKHEIIERGSLNVLDFELEDEEAAVLDEFCKEKLVQAVE
ncbi:DUF6509 family protein [Paenibacillus sp. N1-5-1-14]|uniref:DUF6509 family protein n=1 Tax=Paenibacillus radicibacter TaxID=2972488 RepID=UPI002158CA92|nr:DUF6509 family protein [Paenibacillus radicibacter]MCR8641801.1 DUF6509 family protein [Paenibacillus radicibacter]